MTNENVNRFKKFLKNHSPGVCNLFGFFWHSLFGNFTGVFTDNELGGGTVVLSWQEIPRWEDDNYP